MDQVPKKKMKLSDMKAWSPVNSVKGRKHVHVYIKIIADVDLAVLIPFNPRNINSEPFTFPAATAINDAMGSDETNSLVKAGFFSVALRIKDPNSNVSMVNKNGYEYKVFLARGIDFYSNPDELKCLCTTFVDVSLLFHIPKLFELCNFIYISISVHELFSSKQIRSLWVGP